MAYKVSPPAFSIISIAMFMSFVGFGIYAIAAAGEESPEEPLHRLPRNDR